MVGTALDEVKMGHAVVDMADNKDLDGILDDSLWKQVMVNIRSSVVAKRYSGAALAHFGMAFDTAFRSEGMHGDPNLDVTRKSDSRIESCLALRRCQLISVLISATIPWTLVVPHVVTETMGQPAVC